MFPLLAGVHYIGIKLYPPMLFLRCFGPLKSPVKPPKEMNLWKAYHWVVCLFSLSPVSETRNNTAIFALSTKKGLLQEKFLTGTLKSVRYREVSTKNSPLHKGLLMRLVA